MSFGGGALSHAAEPLHRQVAVVHLPARRLVEHHAVGQVAPDLRLLATFLADLRRGSRPLAVVGLGVRLGLPWNQEGEKGTPSMGPLERTSKERISWSAGSSEGFHLLPRCLSLRFAAAGAASNCRPSANS